MIVSSVSAPESSTELFPYFVAVCLADSTAHKHADSYAYALADAVRADACAHAGANSRPNP